MDQLAQRIVTKVQDTEGKLNSVQSEQVQAEASIALCSVICYMEVAGKKAGELYIDRHEHPHPYVRLELIKRFLGIAMRKYLPPEILFNDQKMMEDAYRLADGMTIFGGFVFPMDEMKAIVQHNQHAIDEYAQRILVQAQVMPNLCMNRPAMPL